MKVLEKSKMYPTLYCLTVRKERCVGIEHHNGLAISVTNLRPKMYRKHGRKMDIEIH